LAALKVYLGGSEMALVFEGLQALGLKMRRCYSLLDFLLSLS
jgi:hypothetical protein